MSYRILRTDGDEERVEARATLRKVKKAISADVLDAVTLTFGHGHVPELVMLVDDTGRIDGRPFNARASEEAGTEIYGDVVIAYDRDFAA